MSKTHTPGPWFVLADPVHKGKHPYHDARYITTSTEIDMCYDNEGPDGWMFEDGGKILCTLTDHEEQAANARLIAAAPKMFEALKELATWFDELALNIDHQTLDEEIKLAEGLVKQTIAEIGVTQ